MANLRRLLFGTLACLLVVSPAFAGARTAPVEEYTGSTGLAKLDDVTKTIMASGSVKGTFGNPIKWTIEKIKDGEVVATLFDRTYMAKVTITYDTENYKITYKDSTNLNYDGKKIHPSYAKWVSALKVNIDKVFTQTKADAANAK